MNVRYPWFPSEQALAMTILSNANMADPGEELYPLSKFVLEYPRLKGGMELLPGIVELYQYLHTEFTYAITYKEATSINLKRLCTVIAKHFVTSGDRKAHYEKLKRKAWVQFLNSWMRLCVVVLFVCCCCFVCFFLFCFVP